MTPEPEFLQLTCNESFDFSTIIVEGRILPFLVQLDLAHSILNPGPGQNQRFCYTLTAKGADTSLYANLSHPVFSICSSIMTSQIVNITVVIDGVPQPVTFPGNVQLFVPPNVDPPTGCPGLKFDFGLSKLPPSVMELCFELTTPFPVGNIDVCLFGANRTAIGSICGPVCGPPPPSLTLAKTCQTPPPSGHFNVGDTATITLTVTNSSPTTATGFTVIDKILVPADVEISSLTTTPPASDITPSPGPYADTDIFVMWGNLTVPGNSSIMLTVTFTFLAAPPTGSMVTNVDAGIGTLSGTSQFTCTIPVVGPAVPILSIIKECPTPTFPNEFFVVGETLTITLTVSNSGAADANGVMIFDEIQVPADVTISNLTTVPAATAITPPIGPYSGVTITIAWAGLTVPAGTFITLTVTFTVLDAPIQGDVITNVNAGSNQIIGTPFTICTIPVIGITAPPIVFGVRGLSIQDIANLLDQLTVTR
ncbi:MAG: hypothetical protein ABSC17_04500 [Thermacetogeniaceae bacterium]